MRNLEVHEQTIQYYASHVDEMRSMLSKDAPGFHEVVHAHLSGGSSILDAGCGAGRDAFLLAEKGYRVDACDPVSDLFFAEKNRDTENPVTFFESDYAGLGDRGIEYDAVLSSAVIQHIPDDLLVASLSGLVSVIQENGFLFIGMPLEYPLVNEEEQIDAKGRLFILRPPEQVHDYLERLGMQLVSDYRFDDSLNAKA